MIFGPNGSAQPYLDFVSASVNYPTTQPVQAYNAMLPNNTFFGTYYEQNTANFDMATGMLRVYVDAIPPSGTSYELNVKLVHMDNQGVLANLQLIITTP